MTEEKKEIKIEFAPGAFDHFEGTQEELDELVAEVQKMFAGKTREELEEMSRPLEEEDFEELPAEVLERIAGFISDAEHKRKLQ
jgi:tRNA threonylcarbamoyladenosine modification (KEOPS) complex Cgi121 subunit